MALHQFQELLQTCFKKDQCVLIISAVSTSILKSNCCTHTAAAGGTDKISTFVNYFVLFQERIKKWHVVDLGPLRMHLCTKKNRTYFTFHNHTSCNIHTTRQVIQLMDILMLLFTLCHLYGVTLKPLDVPPIKIWDVIDGTLGESFCLKDPQTCCGRNLV